MKASDGVPGHSLIRACGGVGTCVSTEDDPGRDGRNCIVSTVVSSCIDEPLHHPIRDHVPPVGDVFIVGQGGEDDFHVVLFGVEWIVSASE